MGIVSGGSTRSRALANASASDSSRRLHLNLLRRVNLLKSLHHSLAFFLQLLDYTADLAHALALLQWNSISEPVLEMNPEGMMDGVIRTVGGER